MPLTRTHGSPAGPTIAAEANARRTEPETEFNEALDRFCNEWTRGIPMAAATSGLLSYTAHSSTPNRRHGWRGEFKESSQYADEFW